MRSHVDLLIQSQKIKRITRAKQMKKLLEEILEIESNSQIYGLQALILRAMEKSTTIVFQWEESSSKKLNRNLIAKCDELSAEEQMVLVAKICYHFVENKLIEFD